jgi:hypothetical protein
MKRRIIYSAVCCALLMMSCAKEELQVSEGELNKTSAISKDKQQNPKSGIIYYLTYDELESGASEVLNNLPVESSIQIIHDVDFGFGVIHDDPAPPTPSSDRVLLVTSDLGAAIMIAAAYADGRR